MGKSFYLITILLVVSCGDVDIPDTRVKLSGDKLTKLNNLGSVELIRNSQWFSTECKIFEAGKTGYYIISGGDKLSDDYAKWKCATELKLLKCPDFIVNPINDEKLALVSVKRGKVTEYSKYDLELCVNYAIEYAPTELRPTSEKVANRDSW